MAKFESIFFLVWILILSLGITISNVNSKHTTVYLTRYQQDGITVKGVMRLHYKINPNIHTTIENGCYIIPDGIYEVKNTFSNKFKQTLPLVCDVPKRNGIRIHCGKYAEYSRGCILVEEETIQSIMKFVNTNDTNGRKTYLCINTIKF